MSISHALQKVNSTFTTVAVLLAPIFFLPITSEFYEYNKQALLIVLASISLLLWTFRLVVEKQVRITRSPIGLPLVAILFSWIISSLLRTPNKWDAFLEPGQTGTIMALTILFFTSINSIHSKKQVENLATTFSISLAVLGVVSLIFTSGLGPSIFNIPFMETPLWSPTGNAFASLIALVIGVVYSAISILSNRKDNTGSRFVINLTTLIIAFVGSSLLMYRLFLMPNNPNRPIFLSQDVSWSIALEALKTSPILGTGPATYLSDFTRFRPISYNVTENWAIRFASSSNFYLQLLTTVGMLGFATFIILVIRTAQLAIKSVSTTNESSLHSIVIASSVTAMLILVSLLFIPISVITLSILYFLLIISVGAYKMLGSSLVHEANIDIVAHTESGAKSPILPTLSFVLAILLVAPTLFFSSRAYLAETYFRQALAAAGSADGKQTYDMLIKAYTTNPYNDSYRLAFSQTNLLLANALAAKKDLSAADRSTISSLIQQSIREAKSAVALNPNKVSNLENLASTYQTIIPLAKGADAWAIASYRQAIVLDPNNPNLRIALGGVLYQLKQYDEAIAMFQQAIDRKPNLANSYYNLSAAYKQKGDFQKAAAAMQAVANLVNKDSADYTKAIAELEDLKKKAGEAATQTTTNKPAEPAQTSLEAPKPLPSPRISPQVELPSELAPETSTTPTPQASPTPRP